MTNVRYLRADRQAPEQIQEMTEEVWLDYARANVYDVDLAKVHGFDTAGCHYWIEVA